MIAIGNGEKCPYCINEMERPNEDVFVNQPDNDFMKHCMEEHKDFFYDDLFGDGKPVRVINEDEKPTYTCCVCGEESSTGFYNYYAGDTEENILCEKGDCWSEWNSDQMQEIDNNE